MRFLAILVLTACFGACFCLHQTVNPVNRCPKQCSLQYEPICGIRFESDAPNRCTFNNMCMLSLYACKSKQRWLPMSVGICEFHSPFCGKIINFYRNHTDLITTEEINAEE